MPALIAYLVCISLFLSGGYFGLNFLAGNFDEPRSTVLLHSDKAQRANEKHKNNISQMNDARAEVAHSSSEQSLAQSDAPSEHSYSAAKTAVIDTSDSSDDISSNIKTATVKTTDVDASPKEATVSVEQNASRETNSHQLTAANDVRDQVTSSSASGEQEAGGAKDLADIAQKAKTTQSVTTTGQIRRPMTTSINSLLKSHSSRSIRKVRNTRRPQRELIKMVLQTIEFPDGRREQRLVSQRRASLDE